MIKFFINLDLLSMWTDMNGVNNILCLQVKRYCSNTQVNDQRTSDSLNEGLPIKMTREKFQRK